MLEYYRLYLPKSKREVKIEVSVPRYRENIVFDTIYFLDGQNAFKDSHASFGRSIRATKTLGIAAKEMNKRILGVSVYNSGTEMGRINEYSPFKIVDAPREWLKQDLSVCEKFSYDFIHTIIPFIEKKYNTAKNASSRAIYGSSLGAIEALYLAYNFDDSFKYVGAFSTPSFLFHDDFINFLKKNITKKKDVFLYVGESEESDDIFDKTVYLNASKELYNFFKYYNTRTRLVINPSGVHNEETWGNHLIDFVNFMYFDDIIYKL